MGGLFVKFSCTKSGISSSILSFSKFLSKLDDFDLNEYIKVIKFDELKVPSVPFQIPSSKTYFGAFLK